MPAAHAARPGAILASERQRQGLTVEDVSNRLRFRPYQIEAVERDDYGKLPQGAFLRGFIKNYAKLLGLNVDRVLAALEEQVPEDPTPRIQVPTHNIRYDPEAKPEASTAFKWIIATVGLLLIAVAALYIAVFPHGDGAVQTLKPRPQPAPGRPAPTGEPRSALVVGEPPAPVSGQSASKPGEGAPTQGQPVTTVPPAVPTEDPKAASAGATGLQTLPPPATVPAPAPTPPPPTPEPVKAVPPGNVILDFTGSSWVRVRDRRGRVIHEQLHPAGATVGLQVEGSVSFVIGNAREVKLRHNGRLVDLARHTDVNVARLTLEN